MRNASQRMSEVFFALCKSLDTPVSLGMWLRYKHGAHWELASKTLDPADYLTPHHFAKDYFVCEYLSKYKGLDTGVDTAEVALQRFKTAEIQCRETNQRLTLGRLRGYSPRVERVLFYAQRKIATLLGDFDLRSMLDGCRWSSGVTSTLSGSGATLEDKIGEFPISVSRKARSVLRLVVQSDPHWLAALGIPAEGPVSLLSSCFKDSDSCAFFTVPKNAKTDRCAAKEPTGNMFLQLGAGSYIRKRLRRAGIDLNDQTNNQRGAQSALADGFATVDMKAASDTISKELVFELLPYEYAVYLDSLRSSRMKYPSGETVRLEKFSSMGNGFTFELESLIFWAVAQAIHDISGISSRALVYGDDILIHSSCVDYFQEVSEVIGFTMNEEKTHYRSLFRESCGAHYFDGVDVTPVYQKEVPDVLGEVYKLANRLRRHAYRSGAFMVCDAVFRAAWLAATRDLTVKHAVPLTCQDDDGLALPKGELLPFIMSAQHGRIKLPVLSYRGLKRKALNQSALYAYWLRFEPEEPFAGLVPIKRRGKYVTRRRHYYLAGTPDVAWV